MSSCPNTFSRWLNPDTQISANLATVSKKKGYVASTAHLVISITDRTARASVPCISFQENSKYLHNIIVSPITTQCGQGPPVIGWKKDPGPAISWTIILVENLQFLSNFVCFRISYTTNFILIRTSSITCQCGQGSPVIGWKKDPWTNYFLGNYTRSKFAVSFQFCLFSHILYHKFHTY